MNPRRLYRCRDDRRIAGVAAGVAEFFDLDPTIVRITWVLSIFFGGFTILLYAIMALVVPLEPEPASTADMPAATSAGAGSTAFEHRHTVASRPRTPGQAGLVLGIVLVVFGSITLADSIAPAWFAGVDLGAALVLALGLGILVAAMRNGTAAPATATAGGPATDRAPDAPTADVA